MYIKAIPKWIQKAFKKITWSITPNDTQPAVYISFDDGPHPVITNWVLDVLEEYQAKATFFCVGKNVAQHQETYKRIIACGHSVGNHSYSHVKGLRTNTKDYLANVKQAEQWIDSKLFRPPYGSLRRKQAHALIALGYKITLWSIIAGDWDHKLSPEECLRTILKHIKPGDIIVLHDSEKAQRNMQYVLPRLLAYCKERGWQLKAIEQ